MSHRCLHTAVTGLACVLAFAISFSVARADAPPAGTVVRFETALGDVDVELFDQAKPVTVQNFLRYVLNNSYSNTFLHRAIPGFIVQGGAYTVDQPESTNRFTQFDYVESFGNIANEYHSGARVSNTYGTIAMAKVEGNPNSASSQWFFNLADNSANLDNQNGGFTVFGKVISGTNVLEQFNAIAKTNGIVDLTWFCLFCGAESSFTDLPVAYEGDHWPNFNDLLYVNVSLLTEPVLDVTPPTVLLTSSPPGAPVVGGSFTLHGTASDDFGVARVIYRIGSAAPVVLTGTTNWSATLNLPPGAHSIQVQSVDGAGNLSEPLTIPVTVVAGIRINVQGNGAVTPALDGTQLVAPKVYKFKAVPGAGQLFVGWSGATNSSNPNLSLKVESAAAHLALTATFASNHFPRVAGVYSGVFGDNPDAIHKAGLITLKTTAKGAFSGKLMFAGRSIPFSGKFNPFGEASFNPVQLAGYALWLQSLSLDLTNGTQQVTGWVRINNVWHQYRADRAHWGPPNPAWTGAARYTMILRGSPDESQKPDGDGFAALTVNPKGVMKVAGVLADNTKITASLSISKNGDWPLYVPLYRGGGVLSGWMKLPDTVQTNVTWIKTALPKEKLYTNGFQMRLDPVVVPYSPPAAGKTVRVVLDGGNLFAQAVEGTATVNARGQLVPIADQLKLKISLAAASGLVKGSFAHPQTGKAVKFNGVFTGAGYGAGFFVNGPVSGRVQLE